MPAPLITPPSPTSPLGYGELKGELRLTDAGLMRWNGFAWEQAVVPAQQISPPVSVDPATGLVTLASGLVVAGGITADDIVASGMISANAFQRQGLDSVASAVATLPVELWATYFGGSTGSDGKVSITFSNPNNRASTAICAFIAPITGFNQFSVESVTTTTFKVMCRNATGVAVLSTNVSFFWLVTMR